MSHYHPEQQEIPFRATADQPLGATDVLRSLFSPVPLPEEAILEDYVAKKARERLADPIKGLYFPDSSGLRARSPDDLTDLHFRYMRRSNEGTFFKRLQNSVTRLWKGEDFKAVLREKVDARLIQIQEFEGFLEDLQHQWENNQRRLLTPEELAYIREMHAKGMRAQSKVEIAQIQTPEEIRNVVEGAYTADERRYLLVDPNMFRVSLRDKREAYKVCSNEIDVKRRIFCGQVNDKPENYQRQQPYLSQIKCYTKILAEEAEGKPIEIDQIWGQITQERTMVQTALLAAAGKTRVEFEAGTPGFILLMGTRAVQSNAFAAKQWGQSIAKITLDNPNINAVSNTYYKLVTR